MSGIKLEMILRSINRFEVVRIEDEFGELLVQSTPFELLEGGLTKAQKDITFDYIRTVNGNITIGIGMNISMWND